MSQVIEPTNPMQAAVQTLYQPIEHELALAERRLADELHNQHPFVDELLRYGGQLGGKRLRPALLLLVAKSLDSVTDEHITLAAVVEMIHTATLVHDDVLDEANTRRHLATVNARWNNETSVLLGDFLFSQAFYMAATLSSTYGCRRIGQSTNIVCEGELKQIASRGQHDLTEAAYFDIINGKTAELCACATHLGAYFACPDPQQVARLEQYGRSLGMAFQIADDLLDLLGDEAKTGKSLGSDLEKQKPTLPIIFTYQQLSANERSEFVRLLESDSRDRHQQIVQAVEASGGFAYARTTAEKFANHAATQLAQVETSDCRDVLQSLCHFVVARSV